MVKRALICVLLLVVASSEARSEEFSTPEISAYEFSIEFIPQESRINVAADLSLTNPGGDSLVSLLFSGRAGIERVEWFVGSDTLKADYRQIAPETLTIALPGSAIGESGLRLHLTYFFPVQISDSGLVILDRGHRWYPLVAANIALCNMKIAVPRGWFAVTGGDPVAIDSAGESARSIWQSRIPMFKVMLAIGRSSQFVRLSEEATQTPLLLYCRSTDSASGRELLHEAAKAFTFFSDQIGPYVHAQLTFVETKMFEGANLGTSIVALGSDMLGPMDRGRAAMLDLAVASQWFGAGVFGKFQDDGFWFLTLALPHYERLLYLRDSQGEEAFQKDMEHGLDRYRQFAGTASDIPILQVDFLNTQEKGNVVAFKGPYLLERVRQKIGPKSWQRFASRLFETKHGEILTCSEFLSELVQIDPLAGSWLTAALASTGMPRD